LLSRDSPVYRVAPRARAPACAPARWVVYMAGALCCINTLTGARTSYAVTYYSGQGQDSTEYWASSKERSPVRPVESQPWLIRRVRRRGPRIPKTTERLHRPFSLLAASAGPAMPAMPAMHRPAAYKVERHLCAHSCGVHSLPLVLLTFLIIPLRLLPKVRSLRRPPLAPAVVKHKHKHKHGHGHIVPSPPSTASTSLH